LRSIGAFARCIGQLSELGGNGCEPLESSQAGGWGWSPDTLRHQTLVFEQEALARLFFFAPATTPSFRSIYANCITNNFILQMPKSERKHRSLTVRVQRMAEKSMFCQ
jgi:hypothetical protein